MDFALDEDQSLMVATVRRWSERALRGWAADADRQGAAPDGLWAAAAELGLLVDAVPASAGGMLEADDGYSHLLRALRGIELGRGCAGLTALCESSVEAALAAARWGSATAQEALFGAIAVRGGAPRIAVTVHDFAGRLTVADGPAGELVLGGRLGPVPGMALASHVLLVAHRAGGPVLALVPTAVGRVTPLDPAPSAWRAAAWAWLDLDGARVSADHVLAGGASAVAEVLSWLHVGLAARAVGVATAAIEYAAAYAEERVQFGRPIGRFESLARMRDESETAIAAARLLVLEAAWSIDRRAPRAADAASRARDLAARVVAAVTIDAVQIYGGYGFVNDFPVEKLMRDARPFEALGVNEAFARVLAAAERT